TQYLTPYDDFTSSAIKMLQVCTDIFPLYPQFYETAYDAWLSVGIDVFAVDLTLGEILMLITEGDDDLVINPGEAFDFLPSLTNSGTYDAVDVMVSINCEAQGITILQDELDYGDIDTGETAYPPDSGFQFTVSDDTALGHAGCMLNAVAINEQGDLNSFSFPLDISVTLYQDGWPVLTESPVQSSPACVDLENDGSAKEIVFGDNSGYLHAVNTQGNELLGWPFDTGDDVWSSPAVADINNDGSIEIIVGSKSGHLFILDENANVLLNLNVGKYIMAAPALGNLDDDADMEIVFGTYSSPASTNMLYAIDPDGSHLPGFPISLGEKIQRGAALADFNGNGYDDIVVGTDSENIYLILDDGSIAEGFPFDQSTGDFRIAPSILELNESEKLILAANRHEQLFAIDSAGNLVFSYETIADINTSCAFINDPAGTVILFGSDDGFLYAIDPDGNDLPGWPVDLGSSVTSDPVIADLDANGDSEIVTGTNSGEFFALNLDGSYHPQFPISHTFGITGPALIIDTDEDGDLEIIAGASNGLVSIDLKSPGLSDDLWSIYRGGYLRRGYFAGSPTNLIIGDLNQDFILDILDIVRLVNIIMGDEPTEHEFNSGDANSDGILNVQDIIIILNIILGS
nr:FG-GAP repeat protein [FCB group bacterium]